MNYVAPTYNLDAFNCPYCRAFANMRWGECNAAFQQGATFRQYAQTHNAEVVFSTAYCARCNRFSAWLNEAMYIPTGGNAPLPHGDMPEAVSQIYREAAEVSQFSPRAAVALLRLALENLVEALGAVGRDINTKIGDLVTKGLSPVIQQSLDSLRVLGNEAIHIGTVDVANTEISASLFSLINLIVEQMITVPKHVASVYSMLPGNKVDGINNRDKDSATPEGD